MDCSDIKNTPAEVVNAMVQELNIDGIVTPDTNVFGRAATNDCQDEIYQLLKKHGAPESLNVLVTHKEDSGGWETVYDEDRFSYEDAVKQFDELIEEHIKDHPEDFK